TTERMRNAILRRRKHKATFFCPVLGCMGDFTRRTNLNAHIRSHNGTGAIICSSLGCRKGFARRYDCKRHERLHTNKRLPVSQ
ncbi:hypothetical protein B0H14DRAFT_2339322, partial [Mycena olivaceomarginata]